LEEGVDLDVTLLQDYLYKEGGDLVEVLLQFLKVLRCMGKTPMITGC
jgi:hypothetical protein